jgi:hypothetical protein
MPLINLSIKHGRTLEEARTRLETAVHEVCARFGPMIQRVEWTADRTAVRLLGRGFEADLRVDAQEVHVTGDLPFLGGLLGSPLVAGLKAIVHETFQKRLTGPG